MSSWAAAPVHWDRLGVKQQSSGGAKPKNLTLLAHGAREAGRQDVVRQSSRCRLDSDCFPLSLASATGDPQLSWLSAAWSVETLAKTTPVKQTSFAHRACCHGWCPTGTKGADSKTEHPSPFPLRYPLYTPEAYAVQGTVMFLRGFSVRAIVLHHIPFSLLRSLLVFSLFLLLCVTLQAAIHSRYRQSPGRHGTTRADLLGRVTYERTLLVRFERPHITRRSALSISALTRALSFPSWRASALI